MSGLAEIAPVGSRFRSCYVRLFGGPAAVQGPRSGKKTFFSVLLGIFPALLSISNPKKESLYSIK